MFNKNKKYIGKSNKKLKKILIIVFSILVIVLITIILIITGNLEKLMGNSVTKYYCADKTWKLEGTDCVRNTVKKAVLYADINLDGKVDNEDINALTDYVNNQLNVDYSMFSNLQISLSDFNQDNKIDEKDIELLKYYINNPVLDNNEKIGEKKTCERGYALNNDNCELKEVIPAEVYDGTVGVNNQSDSKISFGSIEFYKTKVGNIDVYYETSYPISNKNVVISELEQLKNENEGYLAASNLFLYTNSTYTYLNGTGSCGRYNKENNSIDIQDSRKCGGSSDSDYFKGIVKHEFGHSIDWMNSALSGKCFQSYE